jgi:lysyl-tRNA synthetase class 1
MFWSDKLAKEILERKKYKYLDKEIPEFDKYVVKTSASISGVLHIGRLSDTIRGESVFRSLRDMEQVTELIWVAEDMDPLRKIPKGVPKHFEAFIGMPVTDVADPWECHGSYAEHHTDDYFKVLDSFVAMDMKKFSMREEYKRGNFKKEIKKILENVDKVIEIQNKYRKTPLPKNWSPWTPICDNCHKIITPRVLSVEDGKVRYKCQDYRFEKYTAKGCGFEGINDPMKGEGKLMWKSEWAAQWARWGVVAEGAGKEYQVPNSAWWINAEIAEKVLDFPMPVPIFYEHLMIDGQKMSASKGNVVYPKEWLLVAPPELLRFFYNKRLMKSRSFSWKDLPKLYDDFDYHERVYFGQEKIENERELQHIKRLYEISQIKLPGKAPLRIPFDFAVVVSELCPYDDLERAIRILESSGHVKQKPTPEQEEQIGLRLLHAKNWVELHAPEKRINVNENVPEDILELLTDRQKEALRRLKDFLKEERTESEIYSSFFEISKELGLKPRDFFEGAYLVLISKNEGPKLAPFILALGQKRVTEILEQV